MSSSSSRRRPPRRPPPRHRGPRRGPALYGKWESVPDSPVYVVHAAVLRTGKVLMFAGTAETGLPLESAIWDPKTGIFAVQTGNDSYQHDLFCSHHVFLADGKLLVNGGAHPGHGHGINETYVFDPDPTVEKWIQKTDMNYARWYPTSVALPDGKVLTTSGNDQNGQIVDQVELYDPSENNNNGKWDTLPQQTANKTLRIYPGFHLMPHGEILYTGTRWDGAKGLWNNPDRTALFDLKTNTWKDVGDHVVKDRTEGMSVILPPDNKRVMVIGGRGDSSTEVSTDTAEIINFNDSNPKWKLTANMSFKRRNVNAVLLPTGKVLVCAGIEGFKWDMPHPKPVLTAEEYDADKNKWTKLADMKVARQYHSVSLLLPDARVLNLGSVQSGGGHSLIKDVEIFSPPYLFKGPRPTISNAPQEVHHGLTFEVETKQASSIKSVVLVRPMASTHHTDSEQCVIPMSFSKKNANTLNVTAPNGGHPHYLAVEGYYMLFILNGRGVPSEASFISLYSH